MVGQLIIYLYRLSFFRFFLVGGFSTLVQFSLLVVLVEVFGISAVAATAIAYVLSALSNYLLNFYLTFGGRNHLSAFAKFIVVVFIGVNINTFLFWLVNQSVPHYLIAQVVALVGTLIVNFLLHKYWIYRRAV